MTPTDRQPTVQDFKEFNALVRAKGWHAPRGNAASIYFAGRERERDILHVNLNEVLADSPTSSTEVIQGIPDMGKTQLIYRFQSEVEAIYTEHDRDAPYKVRVLEVNPHFYTQS